MPAPLFSRSFLLLQQEGFLIRSCLTTGLTELRNAGVHNKGGFYAALFNLSIGTERLLKSAIIIDHMLGNKLSVPTKALLKKYGHDIAGLYDSCCRINRTKTVLPPLATLHADLQEIVALLNDFAKITRYHNLDTLSSTTGSKDPLLHWDEILASILRNNVSVKKRERIRGIGTAMAAMIADKTSVIAHGLDQQSLSTEQAVTMPELHAEATKHAVVHIVSFLVPLRELLSGLSHQAYTVGASSMPFPEMQEFLDWIPGDRKSILNKKKWP